jgi:hypothetical protein
VSSPAWKSSIKSTAERYLSHRSFDTSYKSELRICPVRLVLDWIVLVNTIPENPKTTHLALFVHQTTSMAAIQEKFEALSLDVPPPTRIDSPQGDAQQRCVPRYLFRVYTQYSDGSTTKDSVMSRDSVNRHRTATITTNVSECVTPKETARLIWGHLRWKHLESDNLMSWTSSLLFAIQYAFYRHAHSKDVSDFKDINIMVIDTTEYPEGTFTRDMDLINAYSTYSEDLEYFGQLRTNKSHDGEAFYFGEFLSQGALKISGRSKIVSAQSMIDAGLLKLHPSFGQSYENPKQEWAYKVLELRREYSSLSPTISRREIGLACDIGRLFGQDFRLPVAIQLAAICLGHLAVDHVALAFEDEEFDGKCQSFSISVGCTNCSLSLFADDELSACAAESSEMMQSSKLPELQRARLIADIVYASHCQSRLEGP